MEQGKSNNMLVSIKNSPFKVKVYVIVILVIYIQMHMIIMELVLNVFLDIHIIIKIE